MSDSSPSARQVIQSQRSSIEILLTRVAEQPELADSLEFQSEWAGYLCVRISGALEVSVQAILSEYVSSCSPEPVRKFVHARLRGRNMKAGEIVKLCSAFNSDWGKSIDGALPNGSDLKLAVDGVVDNRQHAAHGDPRVVSLDTVKKWVPLVFDVIDLVAAECGVRPAGAYLNAG